MKVESGTTVGCSQPRTQLLITAYTAFRSGQAPFCFEHVTFE